MLLNDDIVDIEKPDGIFSHTFLCDCDSSLFLAAMERRQFKTIKSRWCFDVTPLNDRDNFLLQDNGALLRSESLKG